MGIRGAAIAAFARFRAAVHEHAGGLPRPFWVIWTGTLFNRMGTFVLPFLALYLTQRRGFSIAQTGMVAAIYGLGGALANFIGGTLADRIGRRFVMMLALGLGGACMIGLGFAQRIEVIAPATFLVALVTEMYRPAMQAAITDVVPSEDRARAFGLVYWVINLGFAIALVLAGLLASVSFLLLFVVDGLTSILFAIIVWRGVPESRPARVEHPAHLPRLSMMGEILAPYRDRVFMCFIGLMFCFAVMFMQHTLALPLDMAAHGISKPVFGAIMAINGALIVVLQPLLGPLIARRSHSKVLALGGMLAGLGFGLNAVAHIAPVYALGVIIWTVGEIGVLPLGNTVVANLAPVQLRGRYQGAYGLFFGLAVCAAPIVGSVVLQRYGSVTLWTGTLCAALLIAAGHLALEKSLNRAQAARA